mgnify:CR=1 FL=1
MAKMPKEVVEFFQQDPVKVPKVIATVDANGVPNVVPKGSLMAVDEETIAYADLAPGKTRSNLKPWRPSSFHPPGTSSRVPFRGFRPPGLWWKGSPKCSNRWEWTFDRSA